MVVIKRDGREAKFDRMKIYTAVSKALEEVGYTDEEKDLRGFYANAISTDLTVKYQDMNRAINVEEIQDDVEDALMEFEQYKAAKAYIKYRYDHQLRRAAKTLDSKIISLVDGVNETVKQENGNKNPEILSTQRDYMAGELSRDMVERLILPEDIRKAHSDARIHVHDTDYMMQREFNCCLVNLEDMLQNGTVINGTMVEKPHSFGVACTIATQIMAQVASCQYGGQSVSLAHLAPFVDVSRKRIREKVIDEVGVVLDGISGLTEEERNARIDEVVERRVRDEVKRGVQTIQYQINTLMTTNGQAPFVTLFMYLNEVSDQQTKDDLALVIEEVVRQRYEGVKNEQGIWISPAFPKLIYVLEEDNVEEGTPYYYLTELCAKCSAKRLVPDYISEKIMLHDKVDENGDGQCYSCMGCRSFLTTYVNEAGKPQYYGRLTRVGASLNGVNA